MRGADDAVLLGLDGLHDVVHAAGARRVERGEQHRVGVGALVAGAGRVAEVEDLVVQAGDLAALGGDVPAAAQTHRGVAGREVEGARDIGAPVDHERGALGVGGADSDAPDVVVAAVAEFESAEAEAVLARVEGGEQAGLLRHQDIALKARLETVAHLRQRSLHGVLGLRAQRVKTRVQPGDELLLFPQFLG